jgi:uncharacterized protein
MGEPGRFIWHELATADMERAKVFYTALLGWRYDVMDGGQQGPYTIIRAGEKGIGGMIPCGAGTPSSWTADVSVEDVDAAVKRGKAAKGKLLVPPISIPSVGRFAVMADPSGAAIIPFLPDGPDQPEQAAPPPAGTVCWNELYTHDAVAAIKFYKAVFGWSHGTMDIGAGAYHLFKRAGKDVAGMMEVTAEQTPRSQWMPYFAVADVDASFATALASGADTRMAPHSAPGVGRFAIVSDPTGATFGLFRG